MTKSFSNLRARMSPESRARAEAEAKQMLTEIPPNRSGVASWKTQATPLPARGVSLGREILDDREDSA